MSTRGYVGIRKNETDKGGYNHFDSYPTGLGESVLTFIKDNTIESLNSIYDRIVMKENAGDVWNYNRNEINESFEEYNDFLFDSLFCEFAYIINLDENILEFYIGFNKNPEADGRYAYKIGERGYCGVRLAKTMKLEDIMNNKYRADEEEDFVENE
jgi:hypothetical protein